MSHWHASVQQELRFSVVLAWFGGMESSNIPDYHVCLQSGGGFDMPPLMSDILPRPNISLLWLHVDIA